VSDLVQRLTADQPIEVSIRPEPTLDRLRAAIERGYVHVKFNETRGGTELGIRLDREKSDLTGGDLSTGTGNILVVGDLELDYVQVRLHGRIDLQTLAGRGRLEILGSETEPQAS
jgi:hypothetical protein